MTEQLKEAVKKVSKSIEELTNLLHQFPERVTHTFNDGKKLENMSMSEKHHYAKMLVVAREFEEPAEPQPASDHQP